MDGYGEAGSIKSIVKVVAELTRDMKAAQETLVRRMESVEEALAAALATTQGLLGEITAVQDHLLSRIQNDQWRRYKDAPLSLPGVLAKTPAGGVVAGNRDPGWITGRNMYLPLLFGGRKLRCCTEGGLETADIFYFWGVPMTCQDMLSIATAAGGKPLFFVEDGFLKSILTAGIPGDPRYHSGVGFTVDDLGFHFDATRPSRLEMMLNSPLLEVAADERERARGLMRKLVENKLTKYNHQPFEMPDAGRPGRRKVLVVEQAFRDFSISRGLANDQTFADMLQAAIRENPDADILVKVHPDTLAGHHGHTGYYSGIKQEGNVFPIAFSCNPYTLLERADAVYVVSSMLGFEALMAGKEVHVFGMPFYAGWGLTRDRQTCPRRTRGRTLEELFFITYILYSVYVDPARGGHSTIENAIEHILALREEYFAQNRFA